MLELKWTSGMTWSGDFRIPVCRPLMDLLSEALNTRAWQVSLGVQSYGERNSFYLGTWSSFQIPPRKEEKENVF